MNIPHTTDDFDDFLNELGNVEQKKADQFDDGLSILYDFWANHYNKLVEKFTTVNNLFDKIASKVSGWHHVPMKHKKPDHNWSILDDRYWQPTHTRRYRLYDAQDSRRHMLL